LDDHPLINLFNLLDLLVEEFLTASEILQPPVNPETLLKNKACSFFGLGAPSRSKKPQLTSFDSTEPNSNLIKQHWNQAQQLATALQIEAKARWAKCNDEQSALGISWINLLAQRILVPTHWFKSLASSTDYDLPALKKIFPNAAYEIIALRMLDLPQTCIITLVDNSHITKRKSNHFKASKLLEPIESLVLNYVHENSRPKHLNENGWRISGWPVHQLDWRREILRSIPPDISD